MGATDIPNFFRKPYGSGWALVGDAGYHKDPYTAQGITDAFLFYDWGTLQAKNRAVWRGLRERLWFSRPPRQMEGQLLLHSSLHLA